MGNYGLKQGWGTSGSEVSNVPFARPPYLAFGREGGAGEEASNVTSEKALWNACIPHHLSQAQSVDLQRQLTWHCFLNLSLMLRDSIRNRADKLRGGGGNHETEIKSIMRPEV